VCYLKVKIPRKVYTFLCYLKYRLALYSRLELAYYLNLNETQQVR